MRSHSTLPMKKQSNDTDRRLTKPILCYLVGNCATDAVHWLRHDKLNGDAFDDVARDSLLSAIVESRSTRVGMTCKVLDVFKWDALAKQICDSCDAERMGRQT
jgi:hypothetical protein